MKEKERMENLKSSWVEGERKVGVTAAMEMCKLKTESSLFNRKPSNKCSVKAPVSIGTNQVSPEGQYGDIMSS